MQWVREKRRGREEGEERRGGRKEKERGGEGGGEEGGGEGEEEGGVGEGGRGRRREEEIAITDFFLVLVCWRCAVLAGEDALRHRVYYLLLRNRRLATRWYLPLLSSPSLPSPFHSLPSPLYPLF